MKTTLSSLLLLALLAAATVFTTTGCAKEEGAEQASEESIFEDKKPKASYGKIKHVDVGPAIDQNMAKAGLEVFDVKCTACHKYDERYVGPALGTVTERRTPEYIMNMILDTEAMIENDDTVKCLLQEYMMKMPNQSVDEKDARAVLEHLRTKAQ